MLNSQPQIPYKKHLYFKKMLFGALFLVANSALSVSAQEMNINQNPKQVLSGVRDDIAKIQPEFERLAQKRNLLEREKINLSERLVIITEKVRAAEDRIEKLEEDIKTSDMREQALNADLSSRKAETAKILAAMGRLSLSPAMPLGAVEDEAQTVHTALILKNLTAELKKRADALVADLKLLTSMRDELKKSRRDLSQEQLILASDSERLKNLVETRQNHIQETDNDLVETRKKLLALSQQEKTVEDLIEKINLEKKRKMQKAKELELAKIEQAKKAAKLLAANNKNTESKTEKIQPIMPEMVKKQNSQTVKLLSEQKFMTLKGMLSRPVLGKMIHQYGMPDKTGKKRQGVTIQSNSGAIVTAPVNAQIIFADKFKRQGSIVILNPAGKYYIVLSGLGVINVSPGQNVAMGEPIGRMAPGIGQRNLYVEFRKDRTTTNPNDWLSSTTKNQLALSR